MYVGYEAESRYVCKKSIESGNNKRGAVATSEFRIGAGEISECVVCVVCVTAIIVSVNVGEGGGKCGVQSIQDER